MYIFNNIYMFICFLVYIQLDSLRQKEVSYKHTSELISSIQKQKATLKVNFENSVHELSSASANTNSSTNNTSNATKSKFIYIYICLYAACMF